MTKHYQNAYFLLSVADYGQLPADEGIEIAIVGRSNAGKSSVLNQITQNKKLARVSKTPGRTQHINIFVLDKNRRLADLPGYGFAKASAYAKQKWQKTVHQYITERRCLKGLLLVMDIRHPLKDLDWQLLCYCADVSLPVHIILNKADKLSKNAQNIALKKVKAALTESFNSVTLQSFSAIKGDGAKSLRLFLDKWYQFKIAN